MLRSSELLLRKRVLRRGRLLSLLRCRLLPESRVLLACNGLLREGLLRRSNRILLQCGQLLSRSMSLRSSWWLLRSRRMLRCIRLLFGRGLMLLGSGWMRLRSREVRILLHRSLLLLLRRMQLRLHHAAEVRQPLAYGVQLTCDQLQCFAWLLLRHGPEVCAHSNAPASVALLRCDHSLVRMRAGVRSCARTRPGTAQTTRQPAHARCAGVPFAGVLVTSTGPTAPRNAWVQVSLPNR